MGGGGVGGGGVVGGVVVVVVCVCVWYLFNCTKVHTYNDTQRLLVMLVMCEKWKHTRANLVVHTATHCRLVS